MRYMQQKQTVPQRLDEIKWNPRNRAPDPTLTRHARLVLRVSISMEPCRNRTEDIFQSRSQPLELTHLLHTLDFHPSKLNFQFPNPPLLLSLGSTDSRKYRDEVFDLLFLDDQVARKLSLSTGECARRVWRRWKIGIFAFYNRCCTGLLGRGRRW